MNDPTNDPTVHVSSDREVYIRQDKHWIILDESMIMPLIEELLDAGRILEYRGEQCNTQ